MKRVLSFLGQHFRAWFAESFTLVGLLIAWIVLPPGSTRSAVGVAVVFWDDGREVTKKLRDLVPLMALQLQQPAPRDTP